MGLSNGDISIFSVSAHSETPTSQSTSIRSFRSFTDPKHMFTDNKTANSLVLDRTFHVAQLAITTLDVLPLWPSLNGINDRLILLVGTDDLLQVFEWVGAHLNLVETLEDARGSCVCSYAQVQDSRLLIVGSRKKLLVYKVQQQTRNIFNFVLVASHLFRERIKQLQAYSKEAQAIVATGHSFYVVNLTSDFAVHELPKEFATAGTFVQPSSFSYFGLSSNGPTFKIVPCGPGRTLIVNDLQTAMLSHADGFRRLEESRVVLSLAPVAICYLYPCYILITYAKTLEIVDIESGSVIQDFKHLLNSLQVSVTLANGNVFMGAGSLIFHFSVVSAQKQLDQFLSSKDKNSNEVSAEGRLFGVDRALTYIASLDASDPLFQDKNDSVSTSKIRQLYLRDLQKEKAILLFEKFGEYPEALVDISSEWAISLTDILPLFPDFLNGSNHKAPEVARSISHSRKYSIRRVTIDDLEAFKSTEKKDRNGQLNKENNHMSEAASRFSKAVNNFIVYLTEQRRIHYSFVNSSAKIPTIKWKGVDLNVLDVYLGLDEANIGSMLSSCISTIDTTLFLCYFYTKPMLLGPLLRLPNNKCNAKKVNDCLLKKVHLHNEELEGFLSQLLDFYYGRDLHDNALAMLKELAHDLDQAAANNDFEKLLRGPTLSVRYLQKLTNEHIDLVFKYSHWILDENPDTVVVQAEQIFMNESYECESYDNFKVFEFLKSFGKFDALAIRYLEWLLNETDILDLPGRRKHVLKLATKLSLFYLRKLKLLKCSDTDFYESSWYVKFYKLLSSDKEYEPWTILKNIPTSEDKYLRFSIFIYRRLGEHQKSVDILYNQLADLNGAMRYCADVYEQPNGRKTGTELLHKLLEDLLIHYDENQDAVVMLLLCHGQRMSTLNILTALPNTFPLHKLSHFLESTVHSKQRETFKSRITEQLYKVGSTKLYYQLLMAQRDYCVVSSEKDVCQECGKVVGNGMLCAGHGHGVVHYNCVKS